MLAWASGALIHVNFTADATVSGLADAMDIVEQRCAPILKGVGPAGLVPGAQVNDCFALLAFVACRALAGIGVEGIGAGGTVEAGPRAALVYFLLAVSASPPRSAHAGEVVNEVKALSAVGARLRGALVTILLTAIPRKACWTQAEDLKALLHAGSPVFARFRQAAVRNAFLC
jgi:hypothetical protein